MDHWQGDAKGIDGGEEEEGKEQCPRADDGKARDGAKGWTDCVKCEVAEALGVRK